MRLSHADKPGFALFALGIIAFRCLTSFVIFNFYYGFSVYNFFYLVGLGVPVDTVRAILEIRNRVLNDKSVGGARLTHRLDFTTLGVNVKVNEALWLKRFLETGPL